MNIINYYLRDAKEGIKRNIGASIATVLLIFISLSITGTVILFKYGIDNITNYLDSQVKIKVFVDNSLDINKVNDVIKKQSYVKSTTIETKEETLDKLKLFFKGKEYLFEAFKDSSMPNSIIIELKNKDDATLVAKELKKTKGVSDVIYAQEFAKTIINWSNNADRYGLIILFVFIISSILTVNIAINLALFQREKDIRVKLLLGAKESHVRNQFLFEGFVLGLVGSILSSFVVYFIYYNILYKLELNYENIFSLDNAYINIVTCILIVGGSFIGILGSYLSTRKLMKDA